MNKIAGYFIGVREELVKVVWPTRQTTINHTVMVIVISLLVAIFLGAIDFILSKLIEIIVI